MVENLNFYLPQVDRSTMTTILTIRNAHVTPHVPHLQELSTEIQNVIIQLFSNMQNEITVSKVPYFQTFAMSTEPLNQKRRKTKQFQSNIKIDVIKKNIIITNLPSGSSPPVRSQSNTSNCIAVDDLTSIQS